MSKNLDPEFTYNFRCIVMDPCVKAKVTRKNGVEWF